jgi:hypothetical protein
LLLADALVQAAAQPGIAVDRFAREIVRFLKVSAGTLAATECQSVGRARIIPLSLQEAALS